MARVMWFIATRVSLIQIIAGACIIASSLDAQTTWMGTKPIELDRKAASKLIESQVTPEYPPVAKVNYIQGEVLLQILVARNGHVAEAHALRGHPFLAASALKAVHQWIYRPLWTNSGPAPFLTEVNVKFLLRSAKIERLPSQPDQDLQRQVRPPQVLERPRAATPSSIVRMHVLVGENSHIIDSFPISGSPKLFEAAQRELCYWKFRPAYWGAMKVPWYLDVDVPIGKTPASPATAPGSLRGTAPGRFTPTSSCCSY